MRNTSITIGAVCGISVSQRAFHMPTTTHSRATRDQEATFMNLELRLAGMEERLRKMTVEMEALQHKNEALKCRSITTGEGAQAMLSRQRRSCRARASPMVTMTRRGKCITIYVAS